MKKGIFYLIIITIITSLCFIPISVNASEKTNLTPVQAHGKLSVKGKDIVDKNGNIFQLRGVSSHAMYKYSKFLTEESFEYMRDEWKVNAIRLAIYTSTISEINPDTIQKVKDRVDYATNKGLYVIIDWHVLRDGNPNEHKAEAIEFFKDMATTYKDNVNVLYEICNEPNGVTWEDDLKPYAEEVIGEIRNIDNDAIIIVGTPGYSHDIHIVVDNPITEYTNIVYSYHFYAASRGDSYRTRLKETVDKGLPILISECGMVKANGDGNVDYDSAEKWMDLLDEYNIGYIVWQLTNLDEGSSLIKHEVTKLTDWTYDELSDHGKWLVDTLSKYPDDNKIINETYNYLEGAGQKYIVGTNNIVKFKIDADYSLFENDGKVYVDDKLVNSDKYTSKSGSTIIEFAREYMESLSVGKHTLKVVFNNGGIAKTTFYTILPQKNEEEKTTTHTETLDSNDESAVPSQIVEKASTTSSSNPKTGDTILIFVVLFIVSTLGVAGTFKYSRKNK